MTYLGNSLFPMIPTLLAHRHLGEGTPIEPLDAALVEAIVAVAFLAHRAAPLAARQQLRASPRLPLPQVSVSPLASPLLSASATLAPCALALATAALGASARLALPLPSVRLALPLAVPLGLP